MNKKGNAYPADNAEWSDTTELHKIKLLENAKETLFNALITYNFALPYGYDKETAEKLKDVHNDLNHIIHELKINWRIVLEEK